MANHIGQWDEEGSEIEPWEDGKITIGARREDEEDPVYEYNGAHTTSTHFWDADIGDFWKLHVTIPGYEGDFENAYQKARIYGYTSNHPIYIQHQEGSFAGKYYIINLIELYNTGNCVYVGYRPYPLPVGPVWVTPQTVTLPLETARRYAYLILGRIAHLLMDQSVPAHAHGDTHVCEWFWNDCDSYEDWMENNYTYWDHNLTPIMGNRNLGPDGIIDVSCSSNPLRYLFYMTNQVADRFDSDDISGDLNYVSNSNEGNYNTYLGPIYDQLTNYVPPIVPVTDHLKKIGDFSFCFSIKAVASLMYWFAYYTYQFPQNPPPQNIFLSSNLINNKLYRNQTANIIISNLGNTTSPCYEWRMYTCQKDEQHFTYWPVNEAGLQSLTGRFDPVFKMRNNNFNNESCSTGDVPTYLNYWIQVRVYNGAGTSQWSPLLAYHIIPQPTYGPPGGGEGCPFIYTLSPESDTNNYYKVENNILHRSEFIENKDQDIKDLYKIQNTISVVNDKISIIIQENEPDYDYFDQIKLLAVDHPIGTIVGVTENNNIILYDSSTVTSTDNASLNGTANITPFIQYISNIKTNVKGYPDDSVYAHYDLISQKIKSQNILNYSIIPDSLALIGEIGYNQDRVIYPVAAKDYAGSATIYANSDRYTLQFARRENTSTVVIPFSTINDAVEHVDINWYADYELGYLSVVPISYTGFEIIEQPLIEAVHTYLGDVLYKLISKDSNYAELDTTSIITLGFNYVPPIQFNLKRDYIFETNGRYITPYTELTDTRSVFKDNNSKPGKFKLYLNYPNPFNPTTTLKYEMGKAGLVKITVYNLLGQLVAKLVDKYQPAGIYSVEFDGTNFASGLYFYKMDTDTYTDIKKMVLIK